VARLPWCVVQTCRGGSDDVVVYRAPLARSHKASASTPRFLPANPARHLLVNPRRHRSRGDGLATPPLVTWPLSPRPDHLAQPSPLKMDIAGKSTSVVDVMSTLQRADSGKTVRSRACLGAVSSLPLKRVWPHVGEVDPGQAIGSGPGRLYLSRVGQPPGAMTWQKLVPGVDHPGRVPCLRGHPGGSGSRDGGREAPAITVEVWITAALVVPVCRSARCVWER
jgi:hypothetical protein